MPDKIFYGQESIRRLIKLSWVFIEERCDIHNFEIKTALVSHLAENQYQLRKHTG